MIDSAPLLKIGILVLLLSACTIYGLTNDYKKLSEEQQDLVADYSLVNSNKDKVLEINGAEILGLLKEHPKSIVYVYKNDCVSEYCYPLGTYIDFAKEHDYSLFLVMTGYNQINWSIDQRQDQQLYSIEASAYDTRFQWKYVESFIDDLEANSPYNDSTSYQGSLFFFEEDRLKDIRKTLD